MNRLSREQRCAVVRCLVEGNSIRSTVLISGVYAVPENMPEPLATLSIFSPATYVIQGIRHAMIDGESVVDLWPTLLGLLICGIALIPMGVWVFSQAERHAKRTGKLKRSG